MKEHPILFSAPMVRALIDGTKTQTRRVCKPQPFDRGYSKHDHRMAYASGRAEQGDEIDGFYAYSTSSGGQWQLKCPYGQPGDRLWVRETWQGPLFGGDDIQAYEGDPESFNDPRYCQYRADGGPAPEFMTLDDELVCRWRPSIHMPRWASRILLEIVSVRVERLQDISVADARAEGVEPEPRHMRSPCVGDFLRPSVRAYRDLWNDINGTGAWGANPWVWVLEFKRVTP